MGSLSVCVGGGFVDEDGLEEIVGEGKPFVDESSFTSGVAGKLKPLPT